LGLNYLMSSAVFQNDLLMFGDLLAHLRQQGFRIGVDHYLRLQQLLDRVGDRCAPEELRTLLCPIFATSKTQQEQFYKVFDSYFALFQIAGKSAETDEPFIETGKTQTRALKSKSSRRKWLYVATPLTVVALIIALVLFLKPKTSEQSASTQAKTEASASASSENINLSTATAPTSQTQVVTVSESAVQQNSAQASTPTPTPTPERSFYQLHQTGIQTIIILSPLIIFLLYEWYRFMRRKLLLQKQHTRKPPLVWPIKVDAPEAGFYDSEQFLTAARLLRRRQTDEYRRLDVEATVAATIERLGFPDFRYKSDSRVPEYLVLIDRVSYRDHQARLFDELARDLEREGVFVVRYFFDGDPRVCRDESGANVVQLTELQNRYGGHRLLIFGNGEKLLDQITGRLDGWTAIFQHWQDRALLTVEPPARWGLREIALAQLFIVLPATLNGLLALVDHFESTVPADLRSWVGGDFESSGLERTAAEAVATLHRILGEDVFQWLAACAVYTELQWNLTLYIGSLPSMPTGLLTEANLLKLIRLPWFRSGAIPDELRWPLINELSPERQKAVRAALIELLERDPAPPETFASDQYRLNLFAQRWLQSRTHKRLRELMQLVKQLPRSQVLRDLTLIRFLESARRSPLDFLLPNRLRKLFYQRGVPAFGLKTGARFLCALFFVGVVWIGIRAFSPKSLAGNPVPDLVTQNITPSPSPAPENSETPAPQLTAPQPEVTPENTPPTASSSPLPKQETESGNSLSQTGSETGVPTSNPSNIPAQPATSVPQTSAPPVPSPTKEQATTSETPSTEQQPPQKSIEISSRDTASGSQINLRGNSQLNDYTAYRSGDYYYLTIPNASTASAVSGLRGRGFEDVKAQKHGNDFVLSFKLQPGASARVSQSFSNLDIEITASQSNAPVSMGVLNGKALNLPKPDYPQKAVAARVSGRVVVQVTVDEYGKVINASAQSGPQLLQKPAVDAAYKARFSPTLLSGVPVKITGTINYDFTIKQPPPQPMPDQQRPGFPGQQPPGRRP
jgi:TonB family protein